MWIHVLSGMQKVTYRNIYKHVYTWATTDTCISLLFQLSVYKQQYLTAESNLAPRLWLLMPINSPQKEPGQENDKMHMEYPIVSKIQEVFKKQNTQNDRVMSKGQSSHLKELPTAKIEQNKGALIYNPKYKISTQVHT